MLGGRQDNVWTGIKSLERSLPALKYKKIKETVCRKCSFIRDFISVSSLFQSFSWPPSLKEILIKGSYGGSRTGKGSRGTTFCHLIFVHQFKFLYSFINYMRLVDKVSDRFKVVPHFFFIYLYFLLNTGPHILFIKDIDWVGQYSNRNER